MTYLHRGAQPIDTPATVRAVEHARAALENGSVDPGRLTAFIEAEQREWNHGGICFWPKPGHILVCDFSIGFRPPEVIKRRPVIVVSSKAYHEARQCIVVVVSSRKPQKVQPYHLQLEPGFIPNSKYTDAWVKCDLIHHVSYDRLDRFRVNRATYVAPILPKEKLTHIRACIMHAIGCI